MSRGKRHVVALMAWPVFGLVWLAWAAAKAGTKRSRAATLSVAACLAFGLGGGARLGAEPVVPLARAAALAPFTAIALGWGLTHGGEVYIHGNMLVVTGMDGGHGTRSTITVGQVVLTSRESLEADLLAHESIHGDQWAWLGALTPPLYYLSDLIGGGATHNVFEVSAGLEDGGYPG